MLTCQTGQLQISEYVASVVASEERAVPEVQHEHVPLKRFLDLSLKKQISTIFRYSSEQQSAV